MSRSYKKTPVCGDKKSKFFKRYSNKSIRRLKDSTFQHKSFKKVISSWNICDYKEFSSFEAFYNNAVDRWEQWGKFIGKPYPDRDEEYQNWLRWFIRK